jgi:small subunit ribosomal protein S27Ae
MTEKETKEVEEAEEPEVKPEKKTKEKKIEKAKKKRKGVFSYYKIGENGLERLLPFCERCGSGYFMADHDDRYTCGHCGFTRYKHSEESK